MTTPAGTWRSALTRTGFTLVELLLVISIISLLLSIATPSFSQARQAAKRTKCLSNLRQIGTAMGAYFGEHSDAFPWFATSEYANDFRTNQSWFYGGRYPPIAVDPLKVAPELRFLPQHRPFNAHLYPQAAGPKVDLKVYRCPSEDRAHWVGYDGPEGPLDPRTAYLTTGTSYPSNWWWLVFSRVLACREGNELGLMPDYGNQLTRYKLSVRGAGTFAALYGDPLDTMVDSNIRLPGWHGKVGFSEMLFLDAHADYLLTDTTRPDWQSRNTEWTLWFNEPEAAIPEHFRAPYPGIQEYVP